MGQSALELAELAVKQTRIAIPYSANRIDYHPVIGEETPENYLKTLQDLFKKHIKKRSDGDDKEIYEEIRRKIGIEFLPENVISKGIESLFPLIIRSSGNTFHSIEDLHRYVEKKFSKPASDKPRSDMEYIEAIAIRGLKNRIGNCGETSAYALLLLMEYNNPSFNSVIKLERCQYAPPGDHAFLVLNRTAGNIGDIRSWNDDAVICDPWVGAAYTIARWKEWKRSKDTEHPYIIETQYKIELNDPFRENQNHFYVGEKQNLAHNISIHSKKWVEKHKSTKKPFRPISLIVSKMNHDITAIRQLNQAAKKGDIIYIDNYIKSSSLPIDFTVLMGLAIDHGNKNLIEYLIKNKYVDLNKDYLWYLKQVLANNQMEIFNYLMKEVEVLLITLDQNEKIQLLLPVATNGHLQTLKDLFNEMSGPTKTITNTDGVRLLFAAIQNGHLEVLDYLISLKPNLYTPVTKKVLLLHACRNGQLNLVQHFIKDGADPKVVDGLGENLLHIAVKNTYVDLIKYYIDNKLVAIDAKDSLGNNVLHFAAINTYISTDTLKYLIESGVTDVNLQNKNGDTPIKSAIAKKNDAFLLYLLKNKFELIDITVLSSDEVNYLFHLGITDGSMKMIKSLVSKGANIAAVDKDGSTPLHLASYYGDKQIARFLIKNKASVEAKNNKGNTPLYLAVKEGDLTMVKLLMENGANINTINNSNKSPLLKALESNQFDIALYLLRKHDTTYGGIPKFSRDNKEKFLIAAIQTTNTEMAQYLIDTELNESERNKLIEFAYEYAAKNNLTLVCRYVFSGKNAEDLKNRSIDELILSAAKNGYYEEVKNLLKKVDKNISLDPYIQSAMLAAAENGSYSIVKELRDHLFLNRINESDSRALLLFSIKSGNIELVKFFLAGNFDSNNQSKSEPSIYTAVKYNHYLVVKELLANHAKVDTLNGEPLLHIAALHGNLAIIEELLKYGADINEQNKDGESALFTAVENNQYEIVDCLLKAGAIHDPTFSDSNDGLSRDAENYENIPIFEAVEYGYNEIVELLLEHGVKTNIIRDKETLMHTAAKAGNIEIIKYLLDHGVSADQECNGVTPIFNAAEEGHLDVVKELHAKGANINAKYNGENLLYAAVEAENSKNSKELIEYVLKNAASPGSINEKFNDKTPLFLAAETGQEEVVNVLLQHGADDTVLCSGTTAFQIAQQNGHYDIAQKLFDYAKQREERNRILQSELNDREQAKNLYTQDNRLSLFQGAQANDSNVTNAPNETDQPQRPKTG